MLQKNINIYFALVVLFLLSYISCDDREKKTIDIQIKQDNKFINEYNGFYTITDKIFDIIINDVGDKIIHIFAYHNDEMFRKYQYPEKSENTVMFHPATALINSADENMEVVLNINREMQHNAITPEKRINNNGSAIIKVKGVSDIDKNFNGVLYLTIFIDFNNNKIIEENEIKNIKIIILKENNSNLLRERAYISTMGGWIRDIEYSVYSNNYFFVKITNQADKYKFFQLFGPNHGNNSFSSYNRIRDLDYSKFNLYIIYTPITSNIELYNNPYHYSNDNRLFFEIRINNESNRGRYVFYREFRVDKNNDIFEMWTNNNGVLGKIPELKLY
jgi:hypothetical protein